DGAGRRPTPYHLSNHVIIRVGDQDVPRDVYEDAVRTSEFRACGCPTIAAGDSGARTNHTVPGHGCNIVRLDRDSGNRNLRGTCIHHADEVIFGIGYVDVSGRVQKHTLRIVELRTGRGAAVPAKWRDGGQCQSTRRTVSNHGCDVARVDRDSRDRDRRGPGIHRADYGIRRVRDVEISGRVHGYACGAGQFGVQSGLAVAGIGEEVVSNGGLNHRARGCGHFTNHRVEGVRDEDVTTAIDNHVGWVIQE